MIWKEFCENGVRGDLVQRASKVGGLYKANGELTRKVGRIKKIDLFYRKNIYIF